MINPFLLSASQRLEHWKQFRREIAGVPADQQLAGVAAYWGRAPLLNIAYDCDDPRTWPTIWEMVGTGDWCRNSVAIGMEGTLRLAGFDATRLSLGLLCDPEPSRMVMVVRVQDQAAPDAADRLLNYDWASPASVPRTPHRWLRRFRWTGRAYAEF